MRKKLKIEIDKFFIDLEDGGNTVSCTIPIALKKYSLKMEENNLETIAIIGFGVGLSWAGGIIKINNNL
jgi:3-oxoacyl-[acyl-carrier-protein] synthase-3